MTTDNVKHVWGAAGILVIAMLVIGFGLRTAPIDTDAIANAVIVPAPIVDLDAQSIADAVWDSAPEVEEADMDLTIVEKEDVHEAACLALAEDELDRRSFLKDLTDEIEDIEDWEDIDDVTFRDYDVDGFSRSDMRNVDCKVTLEHVRVHYDGDELEKGEITFTIEDGEIEDDDTEFDF